MPAEMKITNETVGTYTFLPGSIPLMTRRVTAQRIGDQGGGHRRIDITLSGYFNGLHTDLLSQYEELALILNGQRVKLYYHDGTRVVMDDELIYFETLSEPEQWKQRLTDYSFNGYYFLEFQPSYNPVAVSFSSQSGNFAFTQIPIIGINKTRDRPNGLAKEYLPSGASVGAEVALQLTGEISENTHADILVAKDALELAFSTDGTLNYGNLSFACHVNKIAWSPGVPINYWQYTIDMVYYISGLIHFQAERQYSRITTSPIVHENPACPNPPYVVERYKEGVGQYVNYHFEAEGESITVIRQLMLNEIILMIHPDGYELPGGNERHSEQSPKVTVDFTKFYKVPVLTNIEEPPPII